MLIDLLVMHAVHGIHTHTHTYTQHLETCVWTTTPYISLTPHVHWSNFSRAEVMSACLQCSVSAANQQHKAAPRFHTSAAMN